MDSNDPKGLVTVTGWNACLNSENGVLALSCTVAADDAAATISGVGLMLNNDVGVTLASLYTEFAGDVTSVTPALNVPSGSMSVGDSVTAVATGEAQGQHFFFEKNITIGNC